MLIEEIKLLKEKLNREVDEGVSYDQILKTSQELDKLISKYYLENV